MKSNIVYHKYSHHAFLLKTSKVVDKNEESNINKNHKMRVIDFFKKRDKKDHQQLDHQQLITSDKNNNTDGRIDKKNNLIEGRYKLSLYELRIFNYFVSKIGENDKEFKEYTLTFDQIINGCNLNRGKVSRNDYQLVKKIVRGLKDKSVEVVDEKEWKVFSLFDVARIPHGTRSVHFQIGKEMMPLLLSLKGKYSTLNLQSVLQLTSVFAVRFYEISIKHLYQGTDSWSFTLSVEEIKHRFELEDKYSRFYDFKKNVIDKACSEINAKTSISLDYTLIKSATNKKKVEKIEFTVARKSSPNNKQITQKIQQKQKDQSPTIKKLKALKIGKPTTLYKSISKSILNVEIDGYTDPDKWFADFFNNWDAVIQARKTETGKEITNLGGYLRTLIENHTLHTPQQQDKLAVQQQKKAREEKEKQRVDKAKMIAGIIDEHLKHNHHTYTEKHFKQYLESLRIIPRQICLDTCKSISDVFSRYKNKDEEYKQLRIFVHNNNQELRQKIKNLA